MKIEEIKNQIFCGETSDILKQIPSNSIDCIITSPPYWKGLAYEAYFNSYYQYLQWSKKWIKECHRVLKNTGTFYLNVANDSETTVKAYELMDIATRKILFKLHDSIIWYRYNQQPANSNRQLTNQTEFVFMLRKTSAGIELNKEACYENAPEMFKTKNVGNVWELPFNSGKTNNNDFGRKELNCKWGHSGFPIKIPESCILLSTKENDIVLDPFIGSGTTAVACINLNRFYVGIDIVPEYVNSIKSKLSGLGCK